MATRSMPFWPRPATTSGSSWPGSGLCVPFSGRLSWSGMTRAAPPPHPPEHLNGLFHRRLDHLKVRLEQRQIVRQERSQQGVADDGRLGVADDGEMRRLRHGSLPVLGREYASLSAACSPDQSASNKEIIEPRAAK